MSALAFVVSNTVPTACRIEQRLAQLLHVSFPEDTALPGGCNGAVSLARGVPECSESECSISVVSEGTGQVLKEGGVVKGNFVVVYASARFGAVDLEKGTFSGAVGGRRFGMLLEVLPLPPFLFPAHSRPRPRCAWFDSLPALPVSQRAGSMRPHLTAMRLPVWCSCGLSLLSPRCACGSGFVAVCLSFHCDALAGLVL